MKFTERALAQTVERVSKSFPVVMATGARQVGKTTLLRKLDPKRRFVTLDDSEVRRLAKEDPSLFLQRFPPPVLIDEFQYAPEILPYIKIAVDEKKTRGIRFSGAFWLTGSQNFVTMENVQESLAGRVAILELFGFSLSEMQGHSKEFALPPLLERSKTWPFSTRRTMEELFALIVQGDKPAICAQKADPQIYYSSYIQTYLERDVRAQVGVRNLDLFDKLLRLLATRMGQLVNLASLASEIGVTIPTLRSWLTVLERSYQILILRPYFRNIGKRFIKTPKLYFYDTGLAAHLLKMTNPKTALDSPVAGGLFENWVISEIVKSYRHRGLDPQLHFWRTRDGQEIDLIQERGGKLFPIQIKLSGSPRTDLFQPIRGMRSKALSLGTERIICGASRNLPLSRDLEIISAWSLR